MENSHVYPISSMDSNILMSYVIISWVFFLMLRKHILLNNWIPSWFFHVTERCKGIFPVTREVIWPTFSALLNSLVTVMKPVAFHDGPAVHSVAGGLCKRAGVTGPTPSLQSGIAYQWVAGALRAFQRVWKSIKRACPIKYSDSVLKSAGPR